MFGSADPLLKRSHAILEQAGDDGRISLAATLDQRGRIFTAQRKYRDAEPMFVRAYETAEGALGKSHPYLKELLRHHAELLRKANRATEAAALESRAAAIQ
jgi:hypothetical protein